MVMSERWCKNPKSGVAYFQFYNIEDLIQNSITTQICGLSAKI